MSSKRKISVLELKFMCRVGWESHASYMPTEKPYLNEDAEISKGEGEQLNKCLNNFLDMAACSFISLLCSLRFLIILLNHFWTISHPLGYIFGVLISHHPLQGNEHIRNFIGMKSIVVYTLDQKNFKEIIFIFPDMLPVDFVSIFWIHNVNFWSFCFCWATKF